MTIYIERIISVNISLNCYWWF